MNSQLSTDPFFQLPLKARHEVLVVSVTPDMAQHWLTFNVTNRGIVNARVNQLKADMEDGNFCENGETIRFAQGKLLDGQHRLTALIMAGVTLRLTIVVGLDPESQVTMDTGRSRTPRDVLTIEGLTKWEASVFGSAVHGIISGCRNGIPSFAVKYTNREVRNFFLENRSQIEQTLSVIRDLPRKPTPLPFSRAMAMHYLFSIKDRSLADVFFQRLFIGDNLPSTSPIFHLRSRLFNDLANRTKRTASQECGMIVKAWNAMRANKSWRSACSLYPKQGEDLEIR